MAGLFLRRQSRAKIKRGKALAGGGNIIVGPLYHHQGHIGDFTQIHALPRHRKGVAGNFPPLKNTPHCGKVKLRRHVHHRQIFIVKPIVGVVIRRLVVGNPNNLVMKGTPVPLGIHGNERRQLQQPWIDLAPHALVFEPHPLDHGLFQKAHGHAPPEIGNLGGCGIRIHRPPDQRQRTRLRRRLCLGKAGRRRKGQRRRLAYRNHMGLRPKVAHEIHQIQCVILNIEAPRRNGNVARIVPVGDVDIAIRQQ